MPRTVPAPTPRLPHRCPVLIAALSAGAGCVGSAIVAGAAAGAVAGTLIVPVYGTIYGGAAGAAVGACIGMVVTPIVVAMLYARHRRPTSVYAPLSDLVRTLWVVMAVVSIALVTVMLWSVWDARSGDLDPLGCAWVVCIGIAAIVVAGRLLRSCVVAICRAWSDPWGVGPG